MSSSASASAIGTGTASGHHDLRIDGYSSLKNLPTGERLSSLPFTVGDHLWRISNYPNGHRVGSDGYISIFLVLEENVTQEVRVQVKFSFRAEKAEKRGLFFLLKKTKPEPSNSFERSFVGPDPLGFPKFMSHADLEIELSKHIKDDSFTIRCHIVVINGARTEKETTPDKSAPKFVSVPPPDLNQQLGGLLLTGKGEDVVFEVGGETFAAHRCVLAARLLVFSAELFGSMKESSGTNGLVRIEGIDAPVFKAMLCFVYTDLLPEMTKEDESVLYQHLLVVADTYNLERLKLICEDKLCKHIDVGTAATILALAEPHQCHGLKSACFDFLTSPANLMAVMATDGFQHLNTICPSVVNELIAIRSVP